MINTSRYTSWKINPPPRKRPCSPEARMEQARRFKAMYSQLGLTEADVARFLQVTTRTVYAWISGRVRIPYAAYKLLRLQLHYELPGDAWKGWSISAGRLYTPENLELHPKDFSWWGLLVRKAALFSAVYESNSELRAAADGKRSAAAAARGLDVARPLLRSKSLPGAPACSKVVARSKMGAREHARQVPPMVITGRPPTVSHHMKPPAV